MERSTKASLRASRFAALTILVLALVPAGALWPEVTNGRRGAWTTRMARGLGGEPLRSGGRAATARPSGSTSGSVSAETGSGSASPIASGLRRWWSARFTWPGRAPGRGSPRGADRTVTFGGDGSVTIPTGASAVSDPMKLDVESLGEIAVSIYLPGNTGPLTIHSLGVSTTYISPAGDFTSASVLPMRAPAVPVPPLRRGGVGAPRTAMPS